MALHLSKPKQRLLTKPSLIHLLSTSSSPPDENNSNPGRNDSSADSSSISSYFSGVKASLKQRQGRPFAPSGTASRSAASTAQLEQIRQNLNDFRRRSTVPPVNISSSSPPSTRTNSFQEAYERNAFQKSEQSNSYANGLGYQRGDFDTVKESIRQIRLKSGVINTEKKGDSQRLTLSSFKQSLNMKMPEGDLGSKVIGGTSAELPVSIFGKEMKGGAQKISGGMRTIFLKTYSPAELGEKLKMLRPQKKEGNWFSLEELNERLIRLRQMDEKEKESALRTGSLPITELRATLQFLQTADDENKKKASTQTLNLLGHLGGTPNFMMHPPKEPLVEKYFHPDNMSSAEKMKIELAKVREEFKMSDSDCGSARVQVAQLTTKIKHLASVLHKKDKHSKKGLQEMVQRRKKLLKYLRRTDWESYCFVLERLGLRDSPDYKN